MTRSPPPPPPPPSYSATENVSDADNAELQELFARFSITPPDSSPRTPSPSPPPTLPTTPPRRAVRYHYHTPERSAVSTSWAEAAAKTQGVSGASPRRLDPKPKPKHKKGGYAVFSGRAVGAFRYWNDDLTRLIIGVTNSLYQGYGTFAEAQATFEYAQAHGWTRIVAPDGSLSTTIARPPSPIGFLEEVNPLHAGRTSLWYVVYAGITPGVYASSLECSLNTLGLSSPAFESCATKEIAVEKFQRAVRENRVRSLYPKYM
ncbi:hypothetical protein C8F04DRAFT_1263682 [Mycena alexandri]|uniref:Ribonuclease H1 N-terminal domain-containing protein n=1 Tax=Mycena alexandri TaxID=1745969 RepID=A0AAD6X0R1_9AGAR|nr:hypothetical protein C8F04DRAFT_1263682 [Mycena alexandri]